MTVALLGVRHHGPGSARAVRAALADLKPDAVLVEGPPEADGLVALAADEDMRPPVALLAYVHGEPARSAFWPFAVYSPEWQAIQHALDARVPVRFFDLPAAHTLAERDRTDAADGETPDERAGAPEGTDDEGTDDRGIEDGETPDGDAVAEQVRLDPLGWLAEAAGYDDAERWWDDVVEHRRAGEPSPFGAIAEAMATLRAHAPARWSGVEAEREARREAHMRTVLRAAAREHERVAVVCGAWHVPALAPERLAADPAGDERLLRGLPAADVAATWVPWTNGRLAAWTGYGAGVASPGWYHHLFTAPDRPVERWLARAAAVLRDEDLPVSSAHVIEAVRLAEALAALRGRPLAGLAEVTEATRAVLCEGDELPLDLVQRRLVVGERLGGVPAATPMVPLARHLHDEQRRVRLKPQAQAGDQDLDLRKPLGLERSKLLHRLRLLQVPWGEPRPSPGGKGTFHEVWALAWRPELDVALIEASAWGTTVPAAAAARARALAAATDATLAGLTTLAESCLLADLAAALADVMRAVRDRAALEGDVTELMAALPPLARSARYGDVRGTDARALGTVTGELVARVVAGLPAAVTGLDDGAAAELLGHVDAVHAAVALLDDADLDGRWHVTLAGLAARDDLHGRLQGRLTRLLLDAGRLEGAEVARRLSRAASAGTPAGRAAAWVEGFLAGGGLLLVHDPALLRLVDDWVTGLPAAAFTAVLPLLRRTFGTFAEPERRAIGEQVRRLGPDGGATGGRGPAAGDDGTDTARAAPAVLAVARILGLEPETDAGAPERPGEVART